MQSLKSTGGMGKTKSSAPMADTHRTNNNFNDTTAISLSTKYRVLVDNLNNVINDLAEQKKSMASFRDSQVDTEALIAEKGDQLKDNIESSISKMDGEIQKSLSHQKAENSRLDQQITQLKSENTIIKNKLAAVQKRIDDILLQIGTE